MKKEKKTGGFFWKLILIIAIAVFCFSAYQLFHIYMGYKAGVDEYNDVAEKATVQVSKPLEPVVQKQTEEGVVVEIAEPEVYPPEIDFTELQAINEDIVGWLQIEALPEISYPIVQGKDNDFYLHKTVKKTDNFAGSIFMDYTNKPDFTDPHTLIYGHNMKNGSMFGKLKYFLSKELYKENKYFWICTPEKKYRYEIFSIQHVGASSDTYQIFPQHDEVFENYINKMASQSEAQLESEALNKDDYVVTLSTCTSNDSTRLVVQGRWIGTY